MSYHRDYHEFDFDSAMIDMMYGMTDLDMGNSPKRWVV